MNNRSLIILNPNSYHHRNGRVWQSVQRECLRQLAPAEVTLAETAAEAEELARAGAMKGHGKIIAAGASETSFGVVNGLMALPEELRKEVRMGLLSLTRPNEWGKTIEFPRPLKRQLEVLRAGHTLPFDIGRVEFTEAAGGTGQRFFLNGAAFGMASRIRHELESHRSQMGRALRGIGQGIVEILVGRGPRLRLEQGEQIVFEGASALALVMVGRYYPALGEVAPQANPSDGELDVVWLPGKRGWQQLGQLFRLMVPLPAAGPPPATSRAQEVLATSQGGRIYLEADGQPLGHLPAKLSTVPRALSMIVSEVGARLKRPRFAPIPKMENGSLPGYSKDIVGF